MLLGFNSVILPTVRDSWPLQDSGENYAIVTQWRNYFVTGTTKPSYLQYINSSLFSTRSSAVVSVSRPSYISPLSVSRMTDRSFPHASSCLWSQTILSLRQHHPCLSISDPSHPALFTASRSVSTHSLLFPPSRDVGNVVNVRNLVNVGRWRNGHTLRTLRENMETKLHQRFLLVNSYGFYVKNTNRFYSYRFHVYVTFCRIRENVYVKIFTYTWFPTLPTLTTYVAWRWKSGVTSYEREIIHKLCA